MIKKRYLYSSIISSIMFIVLYLFLNFNLIISVLITGIMYVGGIFLFKEKDVRKYDPDLIMHYCYLISKINNYNNLIDDEKLKENIISISTESEKIIDMLQQKPDKVTQVYDGFDYFLPFTIKILDYYTYLNKKETLIKEEEKFIEGLEKCLQNIKLEIKKLLVNMNYTKMLDVKSSIEMFKTGNSIATKNDMEKRSI